MDDIFVAGLCLLCWVSGIAFGWLRWRLPHLTARAIEDKLKEKNS